MPPSRLLKALALAEAFDNMGGKPTFAAAAKRTIWGAGHVFQSTKIYTSLQHGRPARRCTLRVVILIAKVIQ